MTKLEILDLGGTGVTDKGLPQLKDLAKLKTISLTDTTVTDGGVKALQKLLPGIDVVK